MLQPREFGKKKKKGKLNDQVSQYVTTAAVRWLCMWRREVQANNIVHHPHVICFHSLHDAMINVNSAWDPHKYILHHLRLKFHVIFSYFYDLETMRCEMIAAVLIF